MVVEDVLVALRAVVVHHERAIRDELAVGRARLGREEVAHPFRRPFAAELLRVDHVRRGHAADHDDNNRAPVLPVLPLDRRPGAAVRDVREYARDRHKQVGEVDDVPRDRAGRQLRQSIRLNEREPRQNDDQPQEEQDHAEAHRDAIIAMPCAPPVRDAEYEKRNEADDANRDVREEHPKRESGRVELILVDCVHHRDDDEVDPRRGEKREPGEDEVQENAQPRADRVNIRRTQLRSALLDNNNWSTEVERRRFVHNDGPREH